MTTISYAQEDESSCNFDEVEERSNLVPVEHCGNRHDRTPMESVSLEESKIEDNELGCHWFLQ